MLGAQQTNYSGAQFSFGPDGANGVPTVYCTAPAPARGLLWGPDRKLDFWKASRAGLVAPEERRAVSLLASYADEERLSYYLYSGLFPALGNVTKKLYMVRRFHTVVELDDGVPAVSWCILTTTRQNVPETDHVITMKNLIEGEELSFRAVANRFEPNTDPFVGTVPLRNHVTNPYVNGRVGLPAPYDDRHGKGFTDLKKWHDLAMFRCRLVHDAVMHLGRMKDPAAKSQKTAAPAQQYKMLDDWESMLLRIRDHLAASYDIEIPKDGPKLFPSNAIPVIQPDGSLA